MLYGHTDFNMIVLFQLGFAVVCQYWIHTQSWWKVKSYYSVRPGCPCSWVVLGEGLLCCHFSSGPRPLAPYLASVSKKFITGSWWDASTLCISLWCWFMGADNYKYNMGINYESLMFYFLVQGLLLCHFEFFFLSVFHLLAFLNPLWAAACTAADTHTHTRTHFYSQGWEVLSQGNILPCSDRVVMKDVPKLGCLALAVQV